MRLPRRPEPRPALPPRRPLRRPDDSLAFGAPSVALGFGAAFIGFFFRNRERSIPGDERTLIAPADGKVIAVGDGKINEKSGQRQKPQVKKNETVLLSKWGGTEVKIGDEELLIVGEEDILAVVE